jgi:hypothetical protein
MAETKTLEEQVKELQNSVNDIRNALLWMGQAEAGGEADEAVTGDPPGDPMSSVAFRSPFFFFHNPFFFHTPFFFFHPFVRFHVPIFRFPVLRHMPLR